MGGNWLHAGACHEIDELGFCGMDRDASKPIGRYTGT